jgi:hypothetical protein
MQAVLQREHRSSALRNQEAHAGCTAGGNTAADRPRTQPHNQRTAQRATGCRAPVEHVPVQPVRACQGAVLEVGATEEHQNEEPQGEHAVDEHVGAAGAAKEGSAVRVPAALVTSPLAHPVVFAQTGTEQRDLAPVACVCVCVCADVEAAAAQQQRASCPARMPSASKHTSRQACEPQQLTTGQRSGGTSGQP